MAKRESLSNRKSRAADIMRQLHKDYPKADCALTHKSAFELLIATILSAQSTDETVNKVTPVLFKRYATPKKLAAAKQEDVEEVVRSTGFFRNKAKNIIGAARKMVEAYDGEVPDDMDRLLTLPGVARKTANVVLGTWFGKNVGVVVDTHVGRLAERMALTWTSRDSKDAVRIEQDLMQVIPQADWTYLSHALIWHGRKVCVARKPRCAECSLAELCPSAGKENGGSKPARRVAGKRASR
ncbi:MAG: endonuclease III [Phycisphaerales bacterium]|nr:endonuclease III [Phycisphaerales bacterium]